MSDEVIVKTAEGNLIDRVYSSPVDEWQHRARGLTMLAVLVLIAIFFAVTAGMIRYMRSLRTEETSIPAARAEAH